MRRIETQSVRLTGAPVGAAVIPVWTAPVPCTVVAVRGLRTGGAAAAVNARVGSNDLLTADMACGNGVFTKSTAVNATHADMDVDELLSVEVASGDATAVVIQVDIAVDAGTL